MTETLIWFLAVSFTCGVGWSCGTALIDLLLAVLLEDDDNGR